jgi:hypothetical protein
VVDKRGEEETSEGEEDLDGFDGRNGSGEPFSFPLA